MLNATEGHVPMKFLFLFSLSTLHLSVMNYVFLKANTFVSDRKSRSILQCYKYKLNIFISHKLYTNVKQFRKKTQCNVYILKNLVTLLLKRKEKKNNNYTRN